MTSNNNLLPSLITGLCSHDLLTILFTIALQCSLQTLDAPPILRIAIDSGPCIASVVGGEGLVKMYYYESGKIRLFPACYHIVDLVVRISLGSPL